MEELVGRFVSALSGFSLGMSLTLLILLTSKRNK